MHGQPTDRQHANMHAQGSSLGLFYSDQQPFLAYYPAASARSPKEIGPGVFFFFLCLHDVCRGTFCSISFFSACMVSLLHRAAGSFVKPPTYHHGIMSAC
jgi:hypothetical protein